MSKSIHLDSPNIGNLEKQYLNRAVDSGYVSTAGALVGEFEDAFAKYLGLNTAVSLQSGTAALHMALHELGIKEGDEVVVPALTFVATINPIIYVGATPVFVDVDRKTWGINPQEIEKSLTRKTKAIIPVHLYGNPCDMDQILAIAKKHKLYVIEDATESLGAKYKGRHTGTWADLGCFSFNGNKILTTGGGGMVVGDNRDRLSHIKFLINQAKDKSKEGFHSEVGFNYRMTNLEAALGLAQMQRLNEFLAKKRRFNQIYKEELKNIEFISFQEEYAQAESSNWLSSIIFEKAIDISGLQKELKSKGIPTRRIFRPITESLPYKRFKTNEHENSYYIYERGLSLPSSTLNSQDDIHYICKTLKEII